MKNSTHKFSSSSSNKTMKKSIKKSRKKYKGGFSRQYKNHYLDDVKGIDKHKDTIYHKSFELGVPYFVKAKKDIFESKNILNLFEKDPSPKFKTSKKEWTSCNTQCRALLKGYIDKEIESTAFFLRILAKSIIKDEKDTRHVQFAITDNDVDQLSGKWENDMKYFNIVYVGNSDDDNDNKIPGRLIMGFGPSASGKTYWAKNVIDMFSGDINNQSGSGGRNENWGIFQNPSQFPKSFLTIDGGLYRECSQIYQFIVRSTLNKGHGGLSNLVSSGVIESSLFNSDTIKDGVVKFLKQQKQKLRKVPISLYVPETLGNCGRVKEIIKPCGPKYQKYIEITGDNYWIGLNIYQHKHALDCTYDEEFKCTGCSESGMMRQHKEGKKYDNTAWQHSRNHGDIEIKKAPGGSFLIHNSGGKKWFPPSRKGPELCKSIITDQSKDSLFNLTKIDKIKKKFHCVYLREPTV